jgi:hypothetical protein
LEDHIAYGFSDPENLNADSFDEGFVSREML